MNYSGIIKDDIANGSGIRTSLFVSGCRNNCPGCFNKKEQDFDYGEPFTDEVMEDIISSVDNPYHSGISILGGDPMEPENAKALLPFVYKFRAKFGNSKSIWLFTGYTYEFLNLQTNDERKSLLFLVDILVDGLFIESQKDLTLKFKGSKNQRIIDIRETKLDKFHAPYVIG